MTQPTDIVERYTSDLERIQEGNRPLPWVVHSGCSYRRIASQPTRENGYRSFSDGNVLHAYVQRPDNHPDLSMGEEQLEALVRLINGCPDLLAEITRLRTELAEAHQRGVKAGLEAALKALKTAQYDPAPYTKGSSAIRAIDPTTLTAGRTTSSLIEWRNCHERRIRKWSDLRQDWS